MLGSILLLPHVCDDVALVIRPEDFYDEANRCVFEHFMALQSTVAADRHGLVGRAHAHRRRIREFGGAAYLAEIARSVPTAANAVHYAQIVRDKIVVTRADRIEHRHSSRCL